MTTEADYLKTIRDTLLAERQKLGINVPAAQIGTQGSSNPIDAGMSSALEQLVILSQLYAGRNQDDVVRNYTEGTLSLVRQYMADRGVSIDTIDKFTGSIQALDTVASGQTVSTFDQQYRRGSTDLTLFGLESAALLSGTQHGADVRPQRPLTEIFASQGGSGAQPEETHVEETRVEETRVEEREPETPMRDVRRTYSLGDIQALREKSVQSVEEQAALKAWTDTYWKRMSNDHSILTGSLSGKSYTEIYKAREDAKAAYENRFQTQREMITERNGLVQENEQLLSSLKDEKMTLTVNGETYRMSWNEMYEECGWVEWNDSSFQTSLRKAANAELERLKEDRGYDARETEVSGLNRRIQTVFSDTYQAYEAAKRDVNTAMDQLRDRDVQMAFQVEDFNAQRELQLAGNSPRTGAQ